MGGERFDDSAMSDYVELIIVNSYTNIYIHACRYTYTLTMYSSWAAAEVILTQLSCTAAGLGTYVEVLVRRPETEFNVRFHAGFNSLILLSL